MSGVFNGEGMLVAFDCDGKAGKRPLVGGDICTLGAAGLEAELCDDYIQMNDGGTDRARLYEESVRSFILQAKLVFSRHGRMSYFEETFFEKDACVPCCARHLEIPKEASRSHFC
jgi:hypothetical protein